MPQSAGAGAVAVAVRTKEGQITVKQGGARSEIEPRTFIIFRQILSTF